MGGEPKREEGKKVISPPPTTYLTPLEWAWLSYWMYTPFTRCDNLALHILWFCYYIWKCYQMICVIPSLFVFTTYLSHFSHWCTHALRRGIPFNSFFIFIFFSQHSLLYFTDSVSCFYSFCSSFPFGIGLFFSVGPCSKVNHPIVLFLGAVISPWFTLFVESRWIFHMMHILVLMKVYCIIW